MVKRLYKSTFPTSMSYRRLYIEFLLKLIIFLIILSLVYITLLTHGYLRFNSINNQQCYEQRPPDKMHSIKLVYPKKFVGEYEYFNFVMIPKLECNRTNYAQIGHGNCLKDVYPSTNDKNYGPTWVLITNFVPMFEQSVKDMLLMYNAHPPTELELLARQSEIVDALQSNLNHPNIRAVHVIVEFQSAVDYLKTLNLENSRKLVIQLVNVEGNVKNYLLYASKCLLNELVVVGHQDTLFGEGWNQVSLDTLKNNRLMYALTRHSAYKSTCLFSVKGSTTCDPGDHYLGSHDAFMLFMREPLSASTLAEMDTVKQNANGMENLLIWVARKRLKYKVTNPCPILQFHHQHCVPIREKNRRRVTNGTTAAQAAYTNNLGP